MGDSVVVIYRSDGSLVRSLALEDLLTSDDLEELPRSVSSRAWSREKCIDTASARLVLLVSRCGWGSTCTETPGTLEIDLNEGMPIGPKRQLVPHIVGRVALAEVGPEIWLKIATKPSCIPGVAPADHATLAFAPLDELCQKSCVLDAPVYTRLAQKARIQGFVVLDLDVSSDGVVECVSIVTSLPFGIEDAARAAAFRWRFRPRLLPAKVRVAFDYRLVDEMSLTPASQTPE
jgi:TonB family protein